MLRTGFRSVEFLQQDIREGDPGSSFDMILCRNAVLTYFAPDEQAQIMARVIARLRPGGALVIGAHESLPTSCSAVVPWPGARAVFVRSDAPTPTLACAARPRASAPA